MGVTYETSRRRLIHRYVCLCEHQSYGRSGASRWPGPSWYLRDPQALAALAPAALELSVDAAGQAGQRRAEVDRIWRQRLERADQACDRTRRQYQLAEPENRLLVRQLEKDWESSPRLPAAAHRGLSALYPAARPCSARPSGPPSSGWPGISWRCGRRCPPTHADRKRQLPVSSTRSRSPRATPARRSTPPSCRPEAADHHRTWSRPVARIRQLTYTEAGSRPAPGTGRAGTDSTRHRQPARRREHPRAPPAGTLQRRRDPPAPAPARPAARPRLLVTHAPPGIPALADGGSLTSPASSTCRPRDAVRMAQARLGNRTPRSLTTAPWIIAADLAEVERWSAVIVHILEPRAA